MPLASLKDLYFDELADLYDAEMQIIRTLPRLAEAARARELREALKKHGDQSRLHLERLDLIFTHWGERPRSRPCVGLAGIVQEADNRLNQEATDDVRDAAIIGSARRMEHYEIAAYSSARGYARQLDKDLKNVMAFVKAHGLELPLVSEAAERYHDFAGDNPMVDSAAVARLYEKPKP